MYTMKIVQDTDPPDPRADYDNVGVMLCFHKNYLLGDRDTGITLDFAQTIEKNPKYIWLPLYLYDHSGITISTTPFSCHWDSGRLGIIFVDRRTALLEYGDVTDDVIEERLKAEVETYDQYLRGDVWGYIVQDDNEEELDSCWGFYGEEAAHEEGMAMLKYWEEKQRSCMEALIERTENHT